MDVSTFEFIESQTPLVIPCANGLEVPLKIQRFSVRVDRT